MFTLRELHDWNVAQEIAPGVWVPARPEPAEPFLWRLRDAWEVLRRRADAFTWPERAQAAQGDAGDE